MKVAELRRRVHLRGDVPALQIVDLVEHDHNRDAEREHTLGDEAIAGTDPLPRREHEEHRVDIPKCMVDRALHAVNETGVGAGEGFTVNVPLPAGCADAEYLQVFQDIVVPSAEKFQPEWILVSAGFDPHRRDPLGGMNVTEEGFGAMARKLACAGRTVCRWADRLLTRRRLRSCRHCAIPWRRCWRPCRPKSAAAPAHLPLAESRIEPLIRRIQQVHEKYQ